MITESDRCCPRCVSKLSESCDYYGRIHYNNEMWYNGCQHCSCNSGKIQCMQIQCESNFCLKDEIQVKTKNNCCLECRKATSCSINHKFQIKENDYYSPDNLTTIQLLLPHNNRQQQQQQQQTTTSACKMCQCINSQLECYSKSCKDLKYPSFSLLKLKLNQTKQINARTIPFFADIIKSMKKKSPIFIVSTPKYGRLYKHNETIEQQRFTLSDILTSKINYKLLNSITNELEYDLLTDYLVLSFYSFETNYVHNVLIIFEIQLHNNNINNEIINEDAKLTARYLRTNTNNEQRIIRDKQQIKIQQQQQLPRKTIYVIPGEAIKLTSNELKPKNLSSKFNSDNLVYFLVSSNLKYGELKLKKTFLYDEQSASDASAASNGWTQVNDIYLEKVVKEFSQKDLDNGNVWYEPLNDLSLSSSKKAILNENHHSLIGCNNNSSVKLKKCPIGELCDETSLNSNDCDNILSFPSFNNNAPGPKYDHCMFEVYDQEQLDLLISKEIIHFSIQNEIINETVLGLEVR
jgi:hypothetical protein